MISTQNKLTPGDDTLPHPEYHEQANEIAKDTALQKKEEEESSEKTSVLAKLKAAKEEVPAPKANDLMGPAKDKSLDL